MGRARSGLILRIAAFAFGIALVGSGLLSRADDKKPDVKKSESGDDLKDELLKLNRVTGEDAQKTTLLAFVKDKEKAKKKVAVAVKMQKDAKVAKDRPFNFG